MSNCFSADQIAEDHIHTDITCNIEEQQQKYRLGTVSYRLLGGGLNRFYLIQTSPSASALLQPNQTITANPTYHKPPVEHQQKNRIGTASKNYLGGGGLKHVLLDPNPRPQLLQ